MQSLLWVTMCSGLNWESLCLGGKGGINIGYGRTTLFTSQVFSAVFPQQAFIKYLSHGQTPLIACINRDIYSEYMINHGKFVHPWYFLKHSFLSVFSRYKEGIPSSLQTDLIPYRIYFSSFIADVFSPTKIQSPVKPLFSCVFDQHSPGIWKVFSKCLQIE